LVFLGDLFLRVGLAAMSLFSGHPAVLEKKSKRLGIDKNLYVVAAGVVDKESTNSSGRNKSMHNPVTKIVFPPLTKSSKFYRGALPIADVLKGRTAVYNKTFATVPAQQAAAGRARRRSRVEYKQEYLFLQYYMFELFEGRGMYIPNMHIVDAEDAEGTRLHVVATALRMMERHTVSVARGVSEATKRDLNDNNVRPFRIFVNGPETVVLGSQHGAVASNDSDDMSVLEYNMRNHFYPDKPDYTWRISHRRTTRTPRLPVPWDERDHYTTLGAPNTRDADIRISILYASSEGELREALETSAPAETGEHLVVKYVVADKRFLNAGQISSAHAQNLAICDIYNVSFSGFSDFRERTGSRETPATPTYTVYLSTPKVNFASLTGDAAFTPSPAMEGGAYNEQGGVQQADQDEGLQEEGEY
jgi:hypothetical protein